MRPNSPWGGGTHLYIILFGVISVLLQIFIPYKRYVRILKWLTLALLAYAASIEDKPQHCRRDRYDERSAEIFTDITRRQNSH